MNIVEMIATQFGSQILGAIASALGIEQKQAQTGISSSIPAILAGLVGLTSKPEGTKTFSNALDQADPGFLDNLSSSLQGGKQDSLIESGAKMLGSLFGDNKVGGLASALAGAAGLKSGIAKSLIGLAAPAVMGMLKKEQKSSGLDLNGLVSMLQGQKQNIKTALPSSLSSQLSSAGLLEGFGDTVSAAVRSAETGARSAATQTTQAAAAAADTGSSFMRWLIPLIILAILAWLAWQFLLAPKPARVTTSPPVTSQMPQRLAPSLVVEGVDLGQKLSGVIADLGTTLSGINDAASANAAVANLTARGESLGAVAELVDKLPPAARQALASLVGPQFSRLESLANRVMDIPGVRSVLGPVVTPILAQISAFLNP